MISLSNHLEKVINVNRRDGVVVRPSASQSVDLGFIPLVESYRKTLKMVSGKPASSLVVFLDKALNGTPHLYVDDR